MIGFFPIEIPNFVDQLLRSQFGKFFLYINLTIFSKNSSLSKVESFILLWNNYRYKINLIILIAFLFSFRVEIWRM